MRRTIRCGRSLVKPRGQKDPAPQTALAWAIHERGLQNPGMSGRHGARPSTGADTDCCLPGWRDDLRVVRAPPWQTGSSGMTWRTRRSALHRRRHLLSAGVLQAPHEQRSDGDGGGTSCWFAISYEMATVPSVPRRPTARGAATPCNADPSLPPSPLCESSRLATVLDGPEAQVNALDRADDAGPA